VVHRDVKPANVLVGATGSDLWAAPIGVKLLDFGIAIDTPRRGEAHALGEAIGDASDASDDDDPSIGTPAYMSPEQLLGEPIDARADQFALGIVLYQMLAGARPFDGDDGRPVIQRVRRDPPRPFKSLGINVPKPLERIVFKCLAKRPADRFGSTQELVIELGHALGERVESLADLAPVHRRVLARAGILDERKHARGSSPPRSQRASRAAGDPLSQRSVPARARTVPLAPAIVGVALSCVAMIAGGGLIQLRTGGLSKMSRAPSTVASAASLESGNGWLRVRVRPWADVVIDGQRAEATPIARAIALRPGRHVVTLVHPNETVRRTVEIVAGATTTLDVTLALMTGSSVSLADEFGPPEPAPSTSASTAPSNGGKP
ncbi:MAG: serine/threonine protein kinase, partial [Polyangiales bacterium]